MQKTLDILEKNVQWIVLGLAALFLLWVAYGYVLTPPATVKINNRVVTPGDVALVTETTAKDLERQIKENRPVSFPTPDLVTSWRQHFAEPFAVAMNKMDFISQPQAETGPIVRIAGNDIPHIDVLPSLPAPQLWPVVAGLSTVIPQAPNMPQNVNGQAAAAPIAPVLPAAAPAPKDTDWITVPAIISADSLKKAMLAPFKNPAPPAIGAIYNTTILRIVLERQQSTGMNNGVPTWPAGANGIQTIAELSAEQPFIPAMPDPSAVLATKYQYLDWAMQNQTLLTDPSFYQVTAGDPWTAPQPPPLTPPGGAPGGNNPAPAPAPRPPAMNPAAMRFPRNVANPLDDRPGSPRFQPFQPYGGFVAPPQGNNANGNIDPFNLTSDILLWAIDDTVTPGQTYRYRIKYVMKNPVFDVKNMAPNNLTVELSVVSAPSNWSEPVKAPPMTKFWVAGAQRDRATLDVFQYVGGEWKPTKNLPAGPGDEVPGTDLTLVDVRPTDPNHSREKYVLLTSNTGDLLRRDVSADEADPDHQQMLNPNPNPNGPNNPPPDRPPLMRPDTPTQRPPFRPTLGHGR